MVFAWGWAGAAGASAASSAIAAKAASHLERLEFKIVCYASVVLCNIIMWSCYVRSLKSMTALQATVVNFASNFFLSGLAGFLFFHEPAHLKALFLCTFLSILVRCLSIPLFWWFIGAAFILLGIWLISNASNENLDDSTKEN